ncbi:MAG: diphthine--ammonia ligase [Nitrososphaerota archaeon]
MKLAALFSGGKDSTYSIYQAKKDGHQISCVVTVFPISYESELLHFPNIRLTKLQSQAMKIPQLAIDADSTNPNSEVNTLQEILCKAKEHFGIEGILHGGILSEFQRKRFESICKNLNVQLVSPLWKKNQKEYMQNLLKENFHFIIISVSSGGLDESWLGKEITQEDLKKLETLSEKFGFNLIVEGGEAETLVTDCPLFSNPIKIKKSNKVWDGYRGRFEILEAELAHNA